VKARPTVTQLGKANVDVLLVLVTVDATPPTLNSVRPVSAVPSLPVVNAATVVSATNLVTPSAVIAALVSGVPAVKTTITRV